MPFETFDNVFDALAPTLAESAGLRARFELLSALQAQVQSWGLSQAAAAARLGITRSRLAALLRGQLSKFSLDTLVDMAATAGVALKMNPEDAIDDSGSRNRLN